jgi:hypothetical protein
MIYDNLEFLNRNSLVNYPLREDATRTDKTGAFTLPNSVIVDFVLVVPENKASASVYLRKLTYLGNLLSLELADDADNAVTVIVVDITTHTKYQGYDVIGIGQYLSSSGRIILGDLAPLSIISNGQYEFAFATTAFEPTTFRPDIRGINGLILVNNNVAASPIYGDVQFVAGTNIKLEEVTPGVIRINAISGEGLVPTDPCATAFPLPPAIRTINGFGPDGNGNFAVQGSACMVVSGQAGILSITDVCSSSCCGCAELEWVTERMEILLQQNVEINGYVNELQSSLTNFQNNVLATTT